MEKNVGTVDKSLRIIVGLVILAVGLHFQTWWGAIGLVPLVTGLVNWCPLYRLIGLNTCKATHR